MAGCKRLYKMPLCDDYISKINRWLPLCHQDGFSVWLINVDDNSRRQEREHNAILQNEYHHQSDLKKGLAIDIKEGDIAGDCTITVWVQNENMLEAEAIITKLIGDEPSDKMDNNNTIVWE